MAPRRYRPSRYNPPPNLLGGEFERYQWEKRALGAYLKDLEEAATRLTDDEWMREFLRVNGWDGVAEFLLSETPFLPHPPHRPGYALREPEQMRRLHEGFRDTIKRIVDHWKERGLF